MSTWKPYAVQAALGGMKLLVKSCARTYGWRIGKHPTPGTKGDRTSHHGSGGIMDNVTALVTVPEVARLETLGDSTTPLVWVHPLLKPLNVRMENLSVPANVGVYGYFWATFQLVEHVEPALLKPVLISLGGARKKGDAAFADLGANMDGLAAGIPGTGGTSLSNAFGNFADAQGDLSNTFDAVDSGDALWRDLSRSLDAVVSSADLFVDAVRDVDSSIGALAYDLTEGAAMVVQAARDAVDEAQRLTGSTVTFVTQGSSDLISLMAAAGAEITEDAIAAAMDANAIEDPFAVLPNTQVTIQIR